MVRRYLVFIVVLLVGFLLWSRLKTPKTSVNQDHPTIDTVAPVSANQISIANFSFQPANVTVAPGTTITWTNNDQTVHDLVVDSVASPELKQGDTFAHTFNTPGTYNYSCGIHPSMTGTVTVK